MEYLSATISKGELVGGEGGIWMCLEELWWDYLEKTQLECVLCKSNLTTNGSITFTHSSAVDIIFPSRRISDGDFNMQAIYDEKEENAGLRGTKTLNETGDGTHVRQEF